MARHIFEFKQMTPVTMKEYVTRNFSGAPCTTMLKLLNLWMGSTELRELFHTERAYDGSNHSLVIDVDYLPNLRTTKIICYIAGEHCHSSLGNIRVSTIISEFTTNEPMTMEIGFRNNNIDYCCSLLKVLGSKNPNNIAYTITNGVLLIQFPNEDLNQVLNFLYSIKESYRIDRPNYYTKNWR